MTAGIVLKFGGTSVLDGERIARVADLVLARRAEGPLVVVSAMGGVTDLLLALSTASREKDRTAVDAALKALDARHRAAVETLALEEDEAASVLSVLARELVRLADLSMGVSLLGELSPRTSDSIAAAGEILSLALLAAALRGRSGDVTALDPRELVATDEAFGAATPLMPAITAAVEEKVLPTLARGGVVVTGGFVGRAPDGSTTTLGRGGSDYTAALLGAALHDAGASVSAIEIWTDVDGILTADPRVVPEARIVPEVSYAEAAELAFFGAKVLHPATIRPAVTRGIPVSVRNTFRPQGSGTSIKAEVAGKGVRAIASRTGVAALFIGNPRMLLAHGYAARVFSVFEKHAVPVDVIATSEVSISVTVEEKAPLAVLCRELEGFAEVTVLRGLAVVSVVGRGLRTTAGIAARIFGALREVNVVLISQGASDTNLTFAVEAVDVTRAVRMLHEELFGRS